MGSLHAAEFANAVAQGGISQEQALHWHLSANHYPPVPVSMIPACVAAIEAANDGEWDRLIPLPEGVTWKGHEQAPASAIIEGHHLQSFLDGDDEDEADWGDDEDEREWEDGDDEWEDEEDELDEDDWEEWDEED